MNWFRIVVACSDAERRAALLDVLGQCGLHPKPAATLSEIGNALAEGPVHLLFCEDVLPDGDFRAALSLAKTTGSGVTLVVTSLLGELDDYLNAMDLGAFDFIAPPYRRSEVESIVNSVRQHYLPTPTERTRLNVYAISRNDEDVA